MKLPPPAAVVLLCLAGGCADEGDRRLSDRQNDILADPFGYGPSADDFAEEEKARPRRELGEGVDGPLVTPADPAPTPPPIPPSYR